MQGARAEDFMSNDKKPKKSKPAVVHGATAASRGGSDLATRLAEPVKKAPLAPAKKKK